MVQSPRNTPSKAVSTIPNAAPSGVTERNSVAKKGSKAPKERINIVYRPATNPTEAVELPFKMLVLADFTGAPDDRPFEDREPTRIDGDSFSEVMKSQGVQLSVSVPNRLEEGEGAGELAANLKFESLKDFTPGGVARQVPELAKLLELREALSALKSPLGNKRDFRKKIEQLLGDPAARKRLMAELGLDEGGES